MIEGRMWGNWMGKVYYVRRGRYVGGIKAERMRGRGKRRLSWSKRGCNGGSVFIDD